MLGVVFRLLPGTVVLTESEGAVRLVRGQHAVVLAGLPPDVTAQLSADRPLPAALAPFIPQLADQGLAADASPIDPLPRARIRLLGSGTLARAVAEALLEGGCAELLIFDRDPPVPGLYAGIAAAEGGRALQRWLTRRETGQAVRTLTHWSKPEHVHPDLTVVAGACREPDRAVLDRLVHDDQPHLLIRPHGEGAVVGPLVEPGRSPCLRCLDVVRTELDPGWPRQLAQLCRQVQHPDPIWSRWAAAVAVRAIWTCLAGRDGDLAGRTIEFDPWIGRPVTRQWPRNPDCGCGWTPA